VQSNEQRKYCTEQFDTYSAGTISGKRRPSELFSDNASVSSEINIE